MSEPRAESLPLATPFAAAASRAAALARGVWAVLWRLALLLVFWGVLAAPVVVSIMEVFRGWAHEHPLRAQICADGALGAALLLATWVLLRFADHRPLAAIGLPPRRLARDVGTGLLIGVAWLGGSLLLGRLAGCVAWDPGGHPAGEALVTGAAAIAVNVAAQQLLLCGYLFHTLRERAGVPAAVVLAASVFSLLHVQAFHGAWLPAVNVFAAGVLFCLAWRVSGGLWLPLGIHFAWNYLVGTVLGLTASGTSVLGRGWHLLRVSGPPLLSGGAFGIEGSALVTLTTGLGIAVLLVRLRRARRAPAVSS